MNIRIRALVIALTLMITAPTQAAGPAARVTDMTSQGGTITTGYPAVLIGGLPAARVGDFASSPLEGCVGGPILSPGSPTVLIGGLAAARVGDLASTQCGLQSIVTGAPTVIIGP